MKTIRLVVDHDHNTNQVRGLLCVACNGLLGSANEDLGVLAAAIEYLEQFGGLSDQVRRGSEPGIPRHAAGHMSIAPDDRDEQEREDGANQP
jgi:hypothetical protein